MTEQPTVPDADGHDVADLAQDVPLLLLSLANLCAGGPLPTWGDDDIDVEHIEAGAVLAVVADPGHPWHAAHVDVDLACARLLCAAGDDVERSWGHLWLLAEQMVELEEQTGLVLSEAVQAQDVVDSVSALVCAAAADPATAAEAFDDAVTAFTTLVTAWAAQLLEPVPGD